MKKKKQPRDVHLLVFTDGRRECLDRTLESFGKNWDYPLHSMSVVNDSQDPEYAAYLHDLFGSWGGVHHNRPKLGFGGTIANAWRSLVPRNVEFVFHLEDDFVFNQFVPVERMIDILDVRKKVVQVALKRQPWNDVERAAGDLVAVHPDAYEEHGMLLPSNKDVLWLEHRLFFTTNPSLYRRELCELGWPEVPQSEGIFTHQLLEDPEIRFAFYGGKKSRPWVHHIGDHRVGEGY